MKEILYDWMFESGSYISHPDHTTLYEALKVSMERENRDEFNEAIAKSRKRCHDDQDPPPLRPKDSDRSKKKKHDSDASPSEQPPVYKLEIWPPSSNGIANRSGRRSSSKLTLKVNPEGNRFVHDMSKPLPLGGLPGHITIQAQYFFNKDLEYLLSGNKERRHALSMSKLKVAYYLNFRLEELVPSLWTESERDYDISSAYGISHWWFKRKEFYITRHSAPSDRNTVRSHMKILSVASSTTYLELTKFTYPPQSPCGLGTSSSETTWKTCNSPRDVIYKDRNNQKKMMRETEMHKFSDGTLRRILEKLDYMVKEYKLDMYNPGMENMIWNAYDKQRSQDQNRRYLPRDNPLVSVEVLRYDIKRSKSENKGKVPTEMELVLEQTQQEHQSDTQVFSVTMEILPEPTSNKLCGSWKSCQGDSSLKMNLPEHRSVLADSKMDMEVPGSSIVKDS
ncbi:hypothetical protein Tco_1335706 [Tanacetum coccineum]